MTLVDSTRNMPIEIESLYDKTIELMRSGVMRQFTIVDTFLFEHCNRLTPVIFISSPPDVIIWAVVCPAALCSMVTKSSEIQLCDTPKSTILCSPSIRTKLLSCSLMIAFFCSLKKEMPSNEHLISCPVKTGISLLAIYGVKWK